MRHSRRSSAKSENDRISSEYKAAKERCDGLKGNAKDICMAEAKGAQKVAKAELEAQDKGTAKAQANVRVAKAEAEYNVAKEKCDDLKGNAKDVCKKDAKAAYTRAKGEAKVARTSKEATKDARNEWLRPGRTRSRIRARPSTRPLASAAIRWLAMPRTAASATSRRASASKERREWAPS